MQERRKEILFGQKTEVMERRWIWRAGTWILAQLLLEARSSLPAESRCQTGSGQLSGLGAQGGYR